MSDHETSTEAVVRALRLPEDCHEEVSRRGEAQPCEKVAVALRLDPEDGLPYAVCAYHARADLVPLAHIARLVTEGLPPRGRERHREGAGA